MRCERFRCVFLTPTPRLATTLEPTGSPALREPCPRAARVGGGRSIVVARAKLVYEQFCDVTLQKVAFITIFLSFLS